MEHLLCARHRSKHGGHRSDKDRHYIHGAFRGEDRQSVSKCFLNARWLLKQGMEKEGKGTHGSAGEIALSTFWSQECALCP